MILYVLRDLYWGQPSDAETEATGVEITRAEAWAQSTAAEVVAFLRHLVNGEPFAGAVSAERAIVLGQPGVLTAEVRAPASTSSGR